VATRCRYAVNQVATAYFRENKVTHFVKLVSGRNGYISIPKKIPLGGISTTMSYFVDGKYNQVLQKVINLKVTFSIICVKLMPAFYPTTLHFQQTTFLRMNKINYVIYKTHWQNKSRKHYFYNGK
jgi:hypothetical protein